MKNQIKTLAIAAAAVLAGAVGWSALADAPAPGMPGGMWMHGTGSTGMGPGMMGGRFADPGTYLSSLKQDLAITEAQGPAWDAYAKTVQDTFASFQSLHEQMDFDAMHSGKDGWAVMNAFHEEHQKAFQALKTAADQLVAKLDDAQKEKARDRLPGLAFGGPGMMGGLGMIGGGMGMMGGGMGMMGGNR